MWFRNGEVVPSHGRWLGVGPVLLLASWLSRNRSTLGWRSSNCLGRVEERPEPGWTRRPTTGGCANLSQQSPANLALLASFFGRNESVRRRAGIDAFRRCEGARQRALKRRCLSSRLYEGLPSGSYIGDPRSTAMCELDGDEWVGGVNAEGDEVWRGGGAARVSGTKGKDCRSRESQ